MSDQPPALVVLMGPPGSGKTTLARHLAPRLRAAWLNSDDMTDAFFGMDRDSTAYVQARPTIYEALYRIAESNLAIGTSVVVDAPHGAVLQSPEWHAQLAARTTRLSARLVVLRCTAPPTLLRQRMISRGEPRDAAKLAGWEAFAAGQPDWSAVSFPHGQIDTSVDLETAVARALDYVRAEAKLTA